MKLDTELTPLIKVNLKWIIDLNVKCKIIEHLESSLRENLDDLGYDDNFLNTTQRHDL